MRDEMPRVLDIGGTEERPCTYLPGPTLNRRDRDPLTRRDSIYVVTYTLTPRVTEKGFF